MIGLENYLIVILPLAALPLVLIHLRKTGKYKVGIIWSIIIALGIVSLSQPYIIIEDYEEEYRVTPLLEDETYSMQVFGEIQPDKIDNLETRTIASGNTSNLRQGILNNVENNQEYILSSDLQSKTDLTGLGQELDERNITINYLEQEPEKDKSVAIRGPETTYPGVETNYSVNVYSSTGEVTSPEVVVDDERKTLNYEGGNEWTFQHIFENEGFSEIQAEVDQQGYFSDNSKYYKAVEIIEKPLIGVNQENELSENLQRFYNVDQISSVDEDSEHQAIITNDEDLPGLRDYIVEGGGMIYTGETYNSEILPVYRSETSSEETDAPQVVISLDISVGTDESGAALTGKQLAYALVDNLPYNTRLGVIAYNNEAHVLSEVDVLAGNREEIRSKIASLESQGSSMHHTGIEGADQILSESEIETGNIVWVSEGRISQLGESENVRQQTLDAASQTSYNIISVGVGDGEERRLEDEDREFLRDVASRTREGFYVEGQNYRDLQFSFEGGGGTSDFSPLRITNNNHFVTRELGVSDRVSSMDEVEVKPGGNILVDTLSNQPFLTTWRYGLGRVAAFSGDNEYLNDIYSSNPSLVLRTVGWSIGDPVENREEFVRVNSGRESGKVIFESNENIESFSRQTSNLYVHEHEPEELGFGQKFGKLYSYNYNEEIERTGVNNDNRQELIGNTGGETIDRLEDFEVTETRQVTERVYLTNYILLAMMLLYISLLGVRKLNGWK